MKDKFIHSPEIAILLFFLLIPAIASGDSMQAEPGTDRMGGDYTKIITPGHNPDDCAQACLEDSRCLAATYVMPDTFQGPEAWCWLKYSVPPSSSNRNCTTYVRVSGGTQHPVYTLQRVITKEPYEDMGGLFLSGHYVIWTGRPPERTGSCDQVFAHDIGAGTTRMITDDPFHHRVEDVDQGRILWTDRSGIVLFNISSGQQKIVVPAPADTSECPRISGNYMIWLDSRNLTKVRSGGGGGDLVHIAYAGGLEIYRLDLATDTEERLTFDNFRKGCPDISGGKIAWTEAHDERIDIVLIDMLTGTRTIIPTNLNYPFSVMIENNRIFWGIGEDIYMYDITKKSSGVIPKGSVNRTSYTPNDDTVIWGGSCYSGKGLEIYDIPAGTIIPVNGSSRMCSPSADGRYLAGLLLHEPDTPKRDWNIVLYALSDDDNTTGSISGGSPGQPDTKKQAGSYSLLPIIPAICVAAVIISFRKRSP